MPIKYVDEVTPDTAPASGGIKYVDETPLLPSVQSARNVAARQTPETGEFPPLLPTSLSNVLNLAPEAQSAVYNAATGLFNIPYETATLLNQIAGSDLMSSSSPEQKPVIEQRRQAIQSGLIDKIQDPIGQIVRAFGIDTSIPGIDQQGQPANALYAAPYSGAIANTGTQLALAAATAPEALPKVGQSFKSLAEAIQSASAAALKAPVNATNKLLSIGINKSAPVRKAEEALAKSIENTVEFDAGSKAALQKELGQDPQALRKTQEAEAQASATLNEADLAARQAENEAATAGQALEQRRAEVAPALEDAASKRRTYEEAQKATDQFSTLERPDEVVVGGETHGSIKAKYDEGKEIVREKFDSVDSAIPNENQLESKSLFSTAKKITKENFSDGFEKLDNGRIKGLVNDLTKTTTVKSSVPQEIVNIYEKATPKGKADLLKTYPDLANGGSDKTKIPAYSWKDLQSGFRKLNSAIDTAVANGVGNDVRILMQLKNEGLIPAMEAHAKAAGSDVFELFQDANKAHGDLMDTFVNSNVPQVLSDKMLKSPKLIVDKLTQANDPSLIADIRKVSSPEAFAQLQRLKAEELFFPDAGQPLSVEHFVKKFKDASTHGTLREWFGDEKFKIAEDFYKAQKNLPDVAPLQKEIESLVESAQKSQSSYEAATSNAQKIRIEQAARKKFNDELNVIKQENLGQERFDKRMELDRKIEDAMKAVNDATAGELWGRQRTALIAISGAAGVEGTRRVLNAFGL